ncbi:hypothetical protein STRTUCAR8_06456 [Streptomyces turgidiscabies Car8]|uniref:DUF3168 domain-containing protein n=2 Tax=Streptomyces turgidiscabies TaxID=85558 RepID=L7ERW4_STRT8|nr:hypothetical protein STRTUCAR8_06456 [Streptomyces turgidiscabies Car8]GAQ70589.1 hypothetical protein T45_02325 [Streptomyces turgidiscabies]
MSMPVSNSAVLPLQVAVLALLEADAELAALIQGVFDWVDEGQTYPYVVIGEAIETPDNTHDSHGSNTVITLHVWSKYRGYAQALTIAARLRALLEHRHLTIAGHRHIATYYVSQQTITDPEPPGDIRHVPVSFRVLTQVSP